MASISPLQHEYQEWCLQWFYDHGLHLVYNLNPKPGGHFGFLCSGAIANGIALLLVGSRAGRQTKRRHPNFKKTLNRIRWFGVLEESESCKDTEGFGFRV